MHVSGQTIWHAKDIYADRGDFLVFMGLGRYEIDNTITNKVNEVYVLNFLMSEKIIQYPIFPSASFDGQHRLDFTTQLQTVLQGAVSLIC